MRDLNERCFIVNELPRSETEAAEQQIKPEVVSFLRY